CKFLPHLPRIIFQDYFCSGTFTHVSNFERSREQIFKDLGDKPVAVPFMQDVLFSELKKLAGFPPMTAAQEIACKKPISKKTAPLKSRLKGTAKKLAALLEASQPVTLSSAREKVFFEDPRSLRDVDVPKAEEGACLMVCVLFSFGLWEQF
ncbi:hypothetical protein HDU98_005799, partial [Podochytrium sp. JEL0797]